MHADIGVIGLAVMGQNLALNIADHGFRVAAYDIDTDNIQRFVSDVAKNHVSICGKESLQDLVAALAKPRMILMMVRAGDVVDYYIDQLVPLLEEGDIVIDGGNSHYMDTDRRMRALAEKGMHFIGAGISGGQEGARHGPAIMPGGDHTAWPAVQPILQAIAAKTPSGEICCDWVGGGGAGHFVKMVHNGIEYGDMQLICEAYDFMTTGLGMTAAQSGEVFRKWNQGALASYLIEITADICAYEETPGTPLLDKILDSAGQKGTGKWTLINATDTGVPLTLIGEAVQARFISAQYDQRQQAAQQFHWSRQSIEGDRDALLKDLEQSILAAKIISYAQGFMLMQQISKTQQWGIDLGQAALLWREGCIIRSVFLDQIHAAYQTDPELYFLGAAPHFRQILEDGQSAWRRIIAAATRAAIPMPCMSAGLTFMDAFTRARLPANLLQAQRDYFGAHTYERNDQLRGMHFHTRWNETGGSVSSNNYQV